MQEVYDILEKAKEASTCVNIISESKRNEALEKMAEYLVLYADDIIAANKIDIANAAGSISDVMIDRLRLDKKRVENMAKGILDVSKLPSPLGLVEKEYSHENGLQIQKVRVPLGVVAIIYESRPNVSADAAALCIKSGNACVLRGGKEAINSNLAIVEILKKALEETQPMLGDALQIVKTTNRKAVTVLMEARGYVDLLIPRGGKGLIAAVVEGAKGVPVIETGTGICHIYVDEDAELDMAVPILYNAKTGRPSVCNSAEVCLVNENIAEKFLPLAKKALDEKNVELRVDAKAADYINGTPASEEDFNTEFLDYILALKVVKNSEEAIKHINAHSTHHSEAIITANEETAAKFCKMVDSAAVYVNASTRFTDGGEFGLGCEMGISTQKVGARGPMGLYELTSYKYIIHGNGQIRE